MTQTGILTRRQTVLATIGVMLSLLLAALDQTIVGTAMPRIVAELQGLDYYAWVTTAYLVTSTTMTPIAGKLGDLFGRKPFLIAGMVGFVASSWLCGLSQNMAELVIFRAIQGLFGGLLFASVFTVLADLFPPQTRARMQGLFGAVFGLASVIGPFTGGYITDHFGWRWVFYVNAPIGVLAVVFVLLWLPFVRTKASWRDIDFMGSFALAAGLVPLLIALSITRDHAWNSLPVVGLLALAAVFLVAFVAIERRVEHPIVPLQLFRNPTFSVSMLVGFLTAFAMFGTIIFTPLIFQGVLGISATNSGSLVTPMMLGLVVASVITGQAMVRIKRYRYLGTLGVIVMGAGLYLLSNVTAASTVAEVVVGIVVVGLGIGVTFPLYINAVQSAVPQNMLGVASSQIQFWRNVGGTVGTAVLGAILARQLPGHIQTQIAGLHLPAQVVSKFNLGSGSSPNSIFDPSRLAATRASLPAAFQPTFDLVMTAVRNGLAGTLHDLFIFGLAVSALALVATVFLREAPLRGRVRAMPEEAPIDLTAGEEPEALTA